MLLITNQGIDRGLAFLLEVFWKQILEIVFEIPTICKVFTICCDYLEIEMVIFI